MTLRSLRFPLASFAILAAAAAACSSSDSTGSGTPADGGTTTNDGSTSEPCIGADGGPCTTVGDDDASTSTDSDGGSVGAACTTDTDCSGDMKCAFMESDGCGAKGSCVEVDKGGNCNAIVLVCACDGTQANAACTGLPSGYVSKPVRFPTQSGCDDVDGGESDDASADH